MWLLGILVIFCLAATVFADPKDPLSQEFIDIVNRKAKTWRAGRNFPNTTSLTFLRGLMGMRPDATNFTLPLRSLQDEDEDVCSQDLPETFDSREHWPNCPTIKEIFDQGRCGSCWAAGATTAMSDRYCIQSNAKKHFRFSVQDVLTCCGLFCGFGCDGGFPHRAWFFWQIEGIVSGGPYGSNHGCKPYTFPPNGTGRTETPKCEKKCQSNYNVDYWKDKHFGKDVHRVKGGETSIRKEIFRNGPVEAGFDVYHDFTLYKEGVYQHVIGKKLGGHAVRVIGWGTENGTPYWLIANSWGATWGDKGCFKILRGKNHCGIEGYVIAGTPKYS